MGHQHDTLFRSLMMDEWDWMGNFLTSNSTYSALAAQKAGSRQRQHAFSLCNGLNLRRWCPAFDGLFYGFCDDE